jgi:putative acetyltransferase
MGPRKTPFCRFERLTKHNEQFIVDALRAAGVLSIALVAEEGALWLGMSRYPLFPFQMGLTSGLALALYPSVLSDKDRVSALVSYAKRLDCLRNVVLGDPAYYKRFGFKPESGFVLPDVPLEYFLAISYGRSLPRGVVTYHDAFSARR